jgi:hypothetical protein
MTMETEWSRDDHPRQIDPIQKFMYYIYYRQE